MSDIPNSNTPRPAPPPVARRAPPPALVGRPAPVASAPVAAGPRRSRLAEATSGLVKEPLSLLVYGVEGVGKTSFAAAAPSPIILGAENGSAELGHVKRLSPTSFEDVTGYLEDLRVDEHPYRTVALDTLDWLEPLVWAATCARGGKSTIESFGFGKGYIEALTEWRAIVRALEALRARGLNVIVVAHAVCKLWKNPDADQGDFDRYTLKLHDKASGLWKEWAKAVLFANFETATVEAGARHKGIDTGKRVLYTRRRAAFDAKNRLWLPSELPLGWAPFDRAVRTGADLRERFYASIGTVGEAERAAAIEHMEQNDYAPEAAESVIAGIAASAK